MASEEQIISLAKGNIYDIFGGTSSEKRLQELEKQWHASGSILYTDPFSVCHTYEEIEEVIKRMNSTMPGSEFKAIGTKCDQILRMLF